MANPNIELLVHVARALGGLRERLVFVGGTATALLITDQAAEDLRDYIAKTFARFLADDNFRNALPGLVIDGSPATRLQVVLERLNAIAQFGKS